MTLSRALLLILLLSLLSSSLAAQKQFFFDQPNAFKHPMDVPRAAMPIVTSEIASIPGCDERTSKEPPSFEASRINLGANRRALIVRVYEDCSHSADGFWFWIFLKTRQGYRSLLRAGTTSLTVQNARTRGFPDIETNSATAEGNYRNVYKFDGTIYKVDLCTHTSFATRKTDRVPCRAQ